jgi:arylsulfatase A-like enzyme
MVNLSRNIIQGAAGGLLGGSLLGLAEAAWLAASGGAPDLLAPFYAVVLYGVIGLAIGVGAGVALSVFELYRKLGSGAPATAFVVGMIGAITPLALFVLMYVVNKEVYAEQGVPMAGKLGILGAVGAVDALLYTVGRSLVLGPLAVLQRGPGVLGVWGALAAVTGGIALMPMGDDPRAAWKHGKDVPSGLKDKPNVLLIAVDTLRADALGAYGKEGNPTPVLDAFAKDSVVFEQHIAQASWTRSSFAALFSSRIASSHNADKKASRLADEIVLLSEALQEAGVTTGNLANNINVTSTFNFDQGYDTFIYESPVYPFGASESVFGLTLYKVVHKLAERLGPKVGIGKEVGTFYQPAEVVLEDAKGFIEANKDSRFYLGVHLMEPHDPYFEHPYLMGQGDAEFNGKGYARAEHESPKADEAEYLAKVYDSEVRHLDKKLAPFFDWLKKAGLYDNTLIVLTADHGEEFGEHGGFWHGTTLYDEQIHIPLIVKLPKGDLAGTRVKWQSRAIDVAPTITATLGVKAGEGWMGEDLLKDVRGEIDEAAKKRRARAEAEAAVATAQTALAAAPEDPAAQAAVAAANEAMQKLEGDGDMCAAYTWSRHRTALAEEDFEGNIIAAIRTGAFKYIKAAPGGPRGLPGEELFDVLNDPGEKRSLMGQQGGPCGKSYSSLPAELDSKLKELISGAASGAVKGGEATIDKSEIAKLCALGYITGPQCEGL